MDRADLYWQRRLVEMERRIERLEAKLDAMTVNPNNTGDTYTVKEFAKALGVCDLTVRRRIEQGLIGAVKIGKAWKIPKTELDKIFE